jgi:uncharacterized membrane protein YwzB
MFNLLLICFAMVYWILGCMELNSFNMSSAFVQSSLHVVLVSVVINYVMSLQNFNDVIVFYIVYGYFC